MVGPLEFAHFAPKRSDPNLKRITTVQVLVSIPSPPGALSLFCLGSCHRWFHQVPQLQRPFLCCCLPNPHSQFWPFIRIPDMTFPLGYLAYPKLNSWFFTLELGLEFTSSQLGKDFLSERTVCPEIKENCDGSVHLETWNSLEQIESRVQGSTHRQRGSGRRHVDHGRSSVNHKGFGCY